MYHTERLAVRVTLALDKGEGLLLYARGQGPDTLLSLGLKHTRPVICIVCTRAVGNVCKQGDLLRVSPLEDQIYIYIYTLSLIHISEPTRHS